VRFDGNTVLPEQELARIAADFVGRQVSADDLQELRYRLTERYIESGYINSGAVLPDQDVVDGIITYRIIEGQLSGIAVTGNEDLREPYIADRLALGAGPPLNVNQLRDRIQILLQDPLINRLNAELRPGPQPGESLLDVAVERARPYEVYLSFDNNVARSIGEFRGQVSTVFRNFTGWGDTVDLLYGRSDGLTEVTGGFALPVNRYDTSVGFRFDYNDAEVVEEPLNELDIISELRSIEVFLNQPVYQTPEQKLTLELALAREQSETTLLGRPFSFSPGEIDGKSDVTVLRFSQNWVSRSPDQVIAARSSFNFGLNALGATDNPEGTPDGQFASWLGQFQWARQFGEAGPQLIFRTDLQLTNDALLPFERLSIGGAESVRGYRKNTLIRDSGIVTSLEGRIPLFRLPIPGLSRHRRARRATGRARAHAPPGRRRRRPACAPSRCARSRRPGRRTAGGRAPRDRASARGRGSARSGCAAWRPGRPCRNTRQTSSRPGRRRSTWCPGSRSRAAPGCRRPSPRATPARSRSGSPAGSS
jgi:hemolysin activation/secretion protein